MILDVGASTGYVSREIDSRLAYDAKWVLLDKSNAALRFAKGVSGSNLDATYKVSTFVEYSPASMFDAIIFSFTMLEIADTHETLVHALHLLSLHGVVIVVLPDCLSDVIQYSRNIASYTPLQEFVDADLNLPKVDPFTGESYPFSAKRVTRFLSEAMSSGLAMIELFRDGEGGRGVFVVVFERI